MGPGEGQPVLFDWRWYYSVPSLPLWILLGLLVVVPGHNRNRQAWLIVILPLLVALFWRLILAVLPEPSAGVDLFAFFSTALAIAWASVWLLGPWLCAGSQTGTLFRALLAMLAVGAVAYFGCFGTGFSSNAASYIVFWSVCAVSLLAATTLSGYCCRRSSEPAYSLLWLLLWMPVTTAACLAVVVAFMMALQPGLPDSRFQYVAAAISVIVPSLVIAGMLYVFNLPVMILALACPCYRERFREMYRLPVASDRAADHPDSPEVRSADV